MYVDEQLSRIVDDSYHQIIYTLEQMNRSEFDKNYCERLHPHKNDLDQVVLL